MTARKGTSVAKPRSGNMLLVGILAGIVAGVLVGGFWPAGGLAIKFLGDVFLRALRMIVVPLVMTSMVVGVSRLGDVRRLGRIGGVTVGYYLATTAVSVLLGIVLVNIIAPGRAETEAERIAIRGGRLLPRAEYRIDGPRITIQGAASDLAPFERAYDARGSTELAEVHMVLLLDQEGVRGVLTEAPARTPSRTPSKIEEATLVVANWTDARGLPATPRAGGTGVRIDLAVSERVKGKEDTIGGALKRVVIGLVPSNIFKAMAETDVLPIITFSLVFGAILTTIGERGRRVLDVFEGVNDAIMKLVHLIMLASPVGIGALVAGRLGDAGGFAGFWRQLTMVGKYAATVLLGLLIHGAIVLPLVLKLFGKRRVGSYTKNVATALATAFSTASSSATLPLTMECVIRKCGVSERTASFVLPLGATVNMDGTALYEAVAAIFIAQVYGIELGLGAMVIVFLTATLAAIGAAGIPEAGLVTMLIVLQAVGLPVEGISLILIVDWFLDRCRTAVNVWGDAVGASVVERYEGGAGEEAAGRAASSGESHRPACGAEAPSARRRPDGAAEA